MAGRLKKGMFGSGVGSSKMLFDLTCGQIRAATVSKNAGWYNGEGEKLGWGDLASEDLEKIAEGLEAGETFVVLGEQESHSNFHGARAKKPEVDEFSPGIGYIAQNCIYVISSRRFYCVNDSCPHETHKHRDLWFNHVERDLALGFIQSFAAKI